MENKEAIEWLRSIEKKYIHGGDEGFDASRREAVKTAIDALSNKPSKLIAQIKVDENKLREIVREEIARIVEVGENKFTVIDTETGFEADAPSIAFIEEWANELIYCDIEGFAITEDGNLILADECGNFVYCPEGRFEIKWGANE